MRRIAALLILTMALAGAARAAEPAPAAPEPFATTLSRQLSAVWKDITAGFNEIFERRENHYRLPERTLLWGEDQRSNATKLNQLMDSLAEKLLSSEAYDALKRMKAQEAAAVQLRAKIAEYEEAMFTAPQSSYNPFAETVDSLGRKIDKARRDIQAIQNDNAAIRRAIVAELEGWGMRLDPEQAELLFSSVIGDDILKNVIILKNVKTVLARLGELAAKSEQNTNVVKRYYGAHLAALDILINLNQGTSHKIEAMWLPRLTQIIQRADYIITDTENSLGARDLNPNQVKTLRSNIESNRMTIRTASLYGRFLVQQKQSLDRRVSALMTDRMIAQNTYDTVQNSSDLTDIIQSGLSVIDALDGLDIPEPPPFENTEQRREFEELSRRMQELE